MPSQSKQITIREIASNIEHRPWGLPSQKWKFYQEWNDALFLHWKVSYKDLRKLVPAVLEIDTINGEAWVSLVAFTMEKIRPRYLPPFSPISKFHEINIRTYVKSNNKTGVYFLSIEGGKRLSCKIAKAMSELPYRYSVMNRKSHSYQSKNSAYDDKFMAQFKIGETLTQKSKLDKWLTERYALFQDAGQSINEFEIHHLEWEVKALEIEHLELSYPRFGALLNESPDKIAYSPGVQVIAWDKVKRRF